MAPTPQRGQESEKARPAKIATKSVFDVRGFRLGIGVFDRPLLEMECRRLKKAWERSAIPFVDDFEINRRQVSFLAKPPRVDAAWRSIDSLLTATSSQTGTS